VNEILIVVVLRRRQNKEVTQAVIIIKKKLCSKFVSKLRNLHSSRTVSPLIKRGLLLVRTEFIKRISLSKAGVGEEDFLMLS
jgi:hypothetical protein